MKGLSILGSTGSIGLSTLEVVRKSPGRFKVISLSAGTNAELLLEQIEEFRPLFVSIDSEEAASLISKKVDCEVGFCAQGVSRAASYDGVQLCVSAISGAAGLVPTLAAIKAGKSVALANKESLVIAGEIVMAEARAAKVDIFPIDSEHSAIFQALLGHRAVDIERIILTASGGPFLGLSKEELLNVAPADALKHPNWEMGAKISIDSSTLLNKGLEVIEARWLFDLPAEKISVMVHPQSIVHSMVEYVDGSIIAQMAVPDMKGPIAYALSYPERIDGAIERLDLTRSALEFEEPDLERFPCLGLAFRALESEGTMPAVLNGADEVAVEAFLRGEISFFGIFETIKSVMDAHHVVSEPTLDDILNADSWARSRALEFIGVPNESLGRAGLHN